MTVTIRNRDFEITFVNNYCREKYQEMLETAEDLADLPDQLAEAKTRAQGKELRKQQKALVQKIGAIREEIMKELLTTNGHEYDAHWWLHSTDIDDINEFVVACLHKDLKASGSKKK